MTKPSANERRLAKLLRELYDEWLRTDTSLEFHEWAASPLTRRSVLAVCAKTVPHDAVARVQSAIGDSRCRYILGNLARGAK